MRNLKRALSLGLTAAMISGLMVMGSSAASYADVTSEDNQEAIEVLQAVGIMVGDENGDFNPDQKVTRNEMAVIMANLMEYNVATYRGTSPFTDVPSWAEPYVAACYTNGLTAGTSATTYGGSDTVTTAQAALMLMKALGYFQYASDFGSDWQLATTRQGNAIDLFNGVNTGVEQALTRNDVAQLVLNTLKSGTVQAENDGSLTIGNVTITNNVKYNYITSNATYANAINTVTSTDANTDAGKSIVELGEKLYQGDLKLEDDEIDDFGRPARTWTLDGDEIGTYAKQELLRQTYTVEVEGGDIYSDVGAAACDYDLSYWVNGVEYSSADTKKVADSLTRRNDDTIGTTGNGVLTEVYVDNDEKETTIVEIHTYLAQATSDYNDRSGKLTMKVYYDINKTSSPSEKTLTRTVDVDDFANIEDYEKDDFMLVTYAGKDREIKSIADPSIVSDVSISAYSVNGKDDTENPYMMKSVTAEGTKYNASKDAAYDAECLWNYKMSELKDTTYNIILDQYGYVVGLEKEDGSSNYAFLVGYEKSSSYLASAIDKALVITVDENQGTAVMEVVDVSVNKMDDTEINQLFNKADNKAHSDAAVNKWVTYEMNGDVMNLKECVDDQFWSENTTNEVSAEFATLTGKPIMADGTIGGSSTNSAKSVYGNSSSIYIAVEADNDVDAYGSIVDINGVTVGIKNTSIEKTNPAYDNAKGSYVLYDGGYVKYAVVVGEDGSIADRLVYLTDGIISKEYDSSLDKDLYVFEGIMGGEYQDEIRSEVANEGKNGTGADLEEGKLYLAKVDADGIITEMEEQPTNWMTANTNNNKDDKYVLAISGKDGLATDTLLELKDGTLYITAASNRHYVILDDNCQFYIRGTNENGKRDSDYELYTDADSAMAVLGNSSYFTGSFAAICDPTTGYATTIIINDAKYEHEYETPVETTGEMVLSNVKVGGSNWRAAAGYADVEDALDHATTLYLSQDQLASTLSFTVASTDGAATAVYGGYTVFGTIGDAAAFATDAADKGAAVPGTSQTVSDDVNLGNGNVILIRANDSTGDSTGSGNLTWFAYIITEQAN